MNTNCKCPDHNHREYTLADALKLAHGLRDFPDPRKEPAPTKAEAIVIIKQHWPDHQWLTGEQALELLREMKP